MPLQQRFHYLPNQIQYTCAPPLGRYTILVGTARDELELNFYSNQSVFF